MLVVLRRRSSRWFECTQETLVYNSTSQIRYGEWSLKDDGLGDRRTKKKKKKKNKTSGLKRRRGQKRFIEVSGYVS